EPFEPTLEQREEIAAVGAVDDERRSVVALTTRGERGEHGSADEPVRNADFELQISDCGLRIGHASVVACARPSNPQSEIHNPQSSTPHSISCQAPKGWQRADRPPGPPPAAAGRSSARYTRTCPCPPRRRAVRPGAAARWDRASRRAPCRRNPNRARNTVPAPAPRHASRPDELGRAQV